MTAADAPVPTVLDDLANIAERLAKSAARLLDLDAESKAERKRRDQLIVAAVDHGGMPQAQVARHAKVSQPHVVRILSQAGDDE